MDQMYRRRPEDGQPMVDLAALCDANEILIVEAENRRRAERAAARKTGRGRGSRRRR